jgi:hypothetical protein
MQDLLANPSRLGETMNRFLRPWPSALLLMLCLGALSGPVKAQSAEAARQRFTPEQRQELFEARRNLERRSHAARIAILREADSCVAAASTPQAFRSCERQEEQARQQFKASIQAEIQALRVRYGLGERRPLQGPAANRP